MVNYDAVENFSTFATSAPTVGSQGFDTSDRHGQGQEICLQLLSVGGTNATASVWLFFGDGVGWITIATALVVATGTATYVKVPPYARCFVQTTANTGATNLLVGIVPGSP